ncbi:MAG: GAF domain-containing protein [Proteobacteria bacterium]|nr:GAF domain-containing protein [Pseudomonadota bacterium]
MDRDLLDYGSYEQTARLKEQLEAFQQISLAVGSEASNETILEMICDKTTQLMRAERTTIFLVEEDNGHMRLNSTIAQGSGVIRLEFGQGIAGYVAKTRETLNIKDVYKSPLFDPSFDKASGFTTRSCLTMPILSFEKKLLGVVQTINNKHGYFTLADQDLLVSICTQIGVSLNLRDFYWSITNKTSELREAHEKLQQKNLELDMLYALEREAAVATDLKSLVQSTLAKCMQAFRVGYAAILMNVGAEHRLYAASGDTRTRISYHPKLIDILPDFLSETLRQPEVRHISLREVDSLPEVSEAVLTKALNNLLISPLLKDDKVFGALILGSQKEAPGVFADSDRKLAALFSVHIAPSLATQLDREEKEKQQRLLTIGQMLSSLLHDMKTPLTNIYGYTQFMVREADPKKRASFAEVINRQVDNLKSMSAEILQFSRGESAIILRKTAMHTLIMHALELLGSEAEKRNIQLVCEENYLDHISCDEVKLLRVIVNLCKNAMEAIDRNGTIRIRTEDTGNRVTLTIEDDGPGIPPAIAKTLFDAFVTSGKKGGTGLGLSIVKKIIEEHNATITWQPVQPHGTAFIMSFPK